MTAYGTYDIVGAKEDVSDIISNIAPTLTPFQSMIGKGKCSQKLFQWQEDSLRAVQVNAQVEGFTASYATLTPTTMRSNTTQIIAKAFQVSESVQATDAYGRAQEASYQASIAAKELKRDLENALIGTAQTKVTGDSSTARKFDGYQAQVASANIVITDSDTGTGGNQAGPLTEANVLTVLGNLYTAGAEADVLMVRPKDGIVVANFAQASGRYRSFNDQKIVNAIDLYVSPYGEVKIVLNRFNKSTDVLAFDASNWELVTFRPWTRETLAKTGDALNMMIVGEFSLKHKNQLASGLINNLS